MKTLLLASAVALTVGSSLSPAFAEGPRPSGHDDFPPSAYNLVQPSQAGHWDWQYHYAGRHNRYEGQWVWVR